MRPLTRCPLTKQQLDAFTLRAAGLSRAQAAAVLGIAPEALTLRLVRGASVLGCRFYRDAMCKLRERGWMPPPHSARIAESYLSVLTAYEAAPRARRDDMLVNALLGLVADDLKAAI